MIIILTILAVDFMIFCLMKVASKADERIDENGT